jgi:hypothetical protein
MSPMTCVKYTFGTIAEVDIRNGFVHLVIECLNLEPWRDVHHVLKTTALTCECLRPRCVALTIGA